MHQYDITILTDNRYFQPTEINEYIYNVLTEDRLLKQALELKGLKVTRTYWDNPDFNWNSTKYAIFRTTWDYFDRFDEFEPWMRETSKKTIFINPIELIFWNLDKHYLQDLQSRNVEIPETIFIEKGDKRKLVNLISKTHWKEIILKPCISGAARHTYRFKFEDINDYEDVFEKLIRNEAMILQEFQFNVLEKGEVAFMLFGGKFSHAVLKIAKPGDFRVQDDFGGTVHEYYPTQEEIHWAESVLENVNPMPPYARVDMIWDNKGRPVVSELEMIEPELWFRRKPEAASMLAEVIFYTYFVKK